MQSIRIRFGCLLLIVFLCGVKAGLRECGEFEKEDSYAFEHQHELEHIFDTYDENDTQHMKQMYKLFENIGTEDLDETDPTGYKNYPIKYVVS